MDGSLPSSQGQGGGGRRYGVFEYGSILNRDLDGKGLKLSLVIPQVLYAQFRCGRQGTEYSQLRTRQQGFFLLNSVASWLPST